MSTRAQLLQSAGESPTEYDDNMEFEEPVRDESLKKKNDKTGGHDSSSSWESDDLEISQAMGSLRESPATFRRPSKLEECNNVTSNAPTRKSSTRSSPPTSPVKQIQRRRSKAMDVDLSEDPANTTSNSQSMNRRRTRSRDPQQQKGDSSPSRTRRSSSRDAASHRQRSSSRDLSTAAASVSADTSSRRTRPSTSSASTSSGLSPRRTRSFAKSARTGSRSIDNDGNSPPSLANATVSQRSSRTLTSRPAPSRVKSKAALLTETPDASTGTSASARPRRSRSTDAESTRRHRSRSRSKDASSRATTHRSRSRDASSRATESPGRLKNHSKSISSRVHSSSMHSHDGILELSPVKDHSSLASHLQHDQQQQQQQQSHHHHSHNSSSHHPHHHHHRSSNKTDDDDVSMASTIYSMEPSRSSGRSHAASDAVSEAASPNEARPRLRGRRPRPEKSASLPTSTGTPSTHASPSKTQSSRSFRRKIGSPTAKPKTLEESSEFDSPRPSRESPVTTTTTAEKSMRNSTQLTSPITSSSRSTKVRNNCKPSPSSHVDKPTSSMSMESAPMSPQTKLNFQAPLSESFMAVPPPPPSPSQIESEKKPSSFFSLDSGKPTSSRSSESAFFSDQSPNEELASNSFVDFGDDSLFATNHISNVRSPIKPSPLPLTKDPILSVHDDEDHEKLEVSSEVLDAFADVNFPVDDKTLSHTSPTQEKPASAMSFTNFDNGDDHQPSSIERTDNVEESKPASEHDVMLPLPNHKSSAQPGFASPSKAAKPATTETHIFDAFGMPTKPFSIRSKASFIPSESEIASFDAFASFDASHDHSKKVTKPPSLDDLFTAAYENDVKNDRVRTLEELFASQQPFRHDKAASVSDLHGSAPNLSLGFDPSVCSSPAASSVADRALLKQSPNQSHSRLGNHFRIRSWGNFAALLAEPSLSSGGTRDDHSDVTSLGSADLSTTGTPKPLRRGLKKSRSFGDVSQFMSRATAPAVRRGKKPTSSSTAQPTHHSFSDDIMAMPAAAAAVTTSAKEGEIRVIRASHTSHTTTAVEDDYELPHNTNDCNSDTGHQSHAEEEQEYLQLCLPATVNTTPAMSAILFPPVHDDEDDDSSLPDDPPASTKGPFLAEGGVGSLLQRRFLGLTPNASTNPNRKSLMATALRGRQRKEEENGM